MESSNLSYAIGMMYWVVTCLVPVLLALAWSEYHGRRSSRAQGGQAGPTGLVFAYSLAGSLAGMACIAITGFDEFAINAMREHLSWAPGYEQRLRAHGIGQPLGYLLVPPVVACSVLVMSWLDKQLAFLGDVEPFGAGAARQGLDQAVQRSSAVGGVARGAAPKEPVCTE